MLHSLRLRLLLGFSAVVILAVAAVGVATLGLLWHPDVAESFTTDLRQGAVILFPALAVLLGLGYVIEAVVDR